MVETSRPSGWVVVEAPGGGSGQKRAPGSRVWEGAAGTWPEPLPHTATGLWAVDGLTTELQDQFIFATAYPMVGLKESVDEQLRFPLSKDVMQKYMYGNAARLLKLG